MYDSLRYQRALASAGGRPFVVPRGDWDKTVELVRHLREVVLQGDWRLHVCRMGHPVIDFASYILELVIEDGRRGSQLLAAVLLRMRLGVFRTEGMSKRQLDAVARARYPSGHVDHMDPFFFAKWERDQVGRPRGKPDSPHTDRQRNKKTRTTSSFLESVDLGQTLAVARRGRSD